jgi:DNA-binding transcriptional LysR family regulator
MELRHLRYFVAVAEELHFRRAADRLHIAQPALSEQVRKLEAELGARLLDRNHRSVELTGAGAAFLVEARHVLRQAERAWRTARRAQDPSGGRLRFGYLTDVLPAAVPITLARFAEGMPGFDVQLQSGTTAELLADVSAGRLDAAAVCLPAQTAGLTVSPLWREGAVVAVPSYHRRARDAAIELAALEDAPLVIPVRTANAAFHDAVIAACRRAGIAPTLVEIGAPLADHALLAVAAGAGIGVLPASTAERRTAPGVRFVPLADPAPSVEVALVTPAGEPATHTASLLRHARFADPAARWLVVAAD